MTLRRRGDVPCRLGRLKGTDVGGHDAVAIAVVPKYAWLVGVSHIPA
jgi:hypothetical protein